MKRLPELSTFCAAHCGAIPPQFVRWAWRLAIAAALLSAIGYFSDPAVSPLMCKVYG